MATKVFSDEGRNSIISFISTVAKELGKVADRVEDRDLRRALQRIGQAGAKAVEVFRANKDGNGGG